MKRIIFTLLTLVLLCQPALAETDYNICFTKVDSDYNDEMTRSEFSDAFPDGDMAVFETADGDKNGTVSHEEWEDYKASQGFEENHEG